MILIYVLIFCLAIPNHPVLAHQLGPLTIFKWYGLLCLFVAFIHMLRTGGPLSRPTPFRWYLIYLFIVVSSCLLHDGASGFGQSSFLFSVSTFVLFLITTTMVSDSNKVRWVVLVAIGSIAWGSLYVIRQWQQYHGIYANFRTWGGLADDPNYYAVGVVLWLPLIVAMLMIRRPRWEKWFSFVCIPVILVGFMFAASRGGFLGLLTALTFLIWNSRNRLRNLTIVAVLLLPLFIGPGQSALDRLLHPSEGDQESSNYRLELWRSAENSFLEHPLFGVGMGHYKPTIVKNGAVIDLPFHVAHNTYVGLIAELGLVGIVPFLAILISALLNLRRVARHAAATNQPTTRQVALGLQAGLLGYLVCAFFLSTLWLQVVWFAVFLSMCLIRIERSKVAKIAEKETSLVASAA